MNSLPQLTVSLARGAGADVWVNSNKKNTQWEHQGVSFNLGKGKHRDTLQGPLN